MTVRERPFGGRFYYGWVIVGVLALTVTVSYGVLMYAFPVVLAAMQAELGWSQQTLMGGYSIGALVGGAAAIPLGRWIDRRGSRAAMTVSAAVASLLVLGWSQVRSPIAFYLIWIGLGACSAGLFYEPPLRQSRNGLKGAASGRSRPLRWQAAWPARSSFPSPPN